MSFFTTNQGQVIYNVEIQKISSTQNIGVTTFDVLDH